jgi:hypothetical protein
VYPNNNIIKNSWVVNTIPAYDSTQPDGLYTLTSHNMPSNFLVQISQIGPSNATSITGRVITITDLSYGWDNINPDMFPKNVIQWIPDATTYLKQDTNNQTIGFDTWFPVSGMGYNNMNNYPPENAYLQTTSFYPKIKFASQFGGTLYPPYNFNGYTAQGGAVYYNICGNLNSIVSSTSTINSANGNCSNPLPTYAYCTYMYIFVQY